MPINPGLTTTASAGQPFYRITAQSFHTANAALHSKVVNGQGAVKSLNGARYNHPGACTVYLAEDLPTCLAEKMFYFHREILTGIDAAHVTGIFPAFQQTFILWKVVLQVPVPDVFDLDLTNAAAMGVFPCMMLNPSQDYHHLKARRAAIENAGYAGLRAPSARVATAGNMFALFHDQSHNLQSITPYDVEFRLVATAHPPLAFANHAIQRLDYGSGEVRISPHPTSAMPQGAAFQNWTRMNFNH